MIELRGPSPLVSVVMPVLRPHPVYFREAIRSILLQSFQAWELIIVEDPSLSHCAGEFLADFDDCRIRYQLNSQRTSLSAQRNAALSLARAPFVAFFDADDVSDASRLEKEVEYLEAHPEVGAVGSQVWLIDEEGTRRGRHSFPREHEDILRAMPHFDPVCQGSGLFRKKLIDEVGGFQIGQPDTCEDYDLLSRLALGGVRFANLPDFLLGYRFHPEHMKATRLRDIIRDVLYVKRRYWRDKMTLAAKARMGAERCLLWLPPKLSWGLVMCMKYNYYRLWTGMTRKGRVGISDGRVPQLTLSVAPAEARS